MPEDKQNVSFEHWGNKEFTTNLDVIKNLRKTYSNYPYLYEYDEDEEIEYLHAYLQTGDDLDAFVCRINGNVIGISIGCRLITSIPICEGFDDLNINTDKAYYFGDIIIAKEAWGQGIADQLYAQHVSHVRKKEYKNILALLVERAPDDHRKPSGYRPSTLWSKHGFIATDQMKQFTWNTRSFTDEPATRETHDLRVYEKTF